MNKTIDLRKLPAVRRRNKELRKKNQKIDSEKYLVQCKKEVKNLKSKLEKLRELGINHVVKPVNAPEESVVALVSPKEAKVQKTPQKRKVQNVRRKSVTLK